MRDKVPQMEYFFCDTGYELQETYEYLERLEAFIGETDRTPQSRAGFRPLAEGLWRVSSIITDAPVHAHAKAEAVRGFRWW